MSGSTAVMEPISEATLTKYVRFFIGSFRTGEADDGEVLTRGLTALLGSYPEWVVRAVCDPRSGLPATSKFFPTLYEVRTACEAKMRPLLEAERRRRIEADNEADRPAQVDPDAAARRKAVVAELRAQQAIREAQEATATTPLAQMDARGLHGDHAALVRKAIEADISRQSERNRAQPVQLSEATLKAMRERVAV